MKRFVLSALSPFVFTLATSVQADPTYMVGITYTFGNNDIGFTAKILSDDEEESAVAAAGVSFYPMAEQKWGLDVGVGYVQDDVAATLGWDFLQKKAALAVGYADLEEDKDDSTYTPPETDDDSPGDLPLIISPTDSPTERPADDLTDQAR